MVTKKPVSVFEATETMLGGLDLDDVGLAKASAALGLAKKLDACVAKDPTGGDPTAGIAKEWRELVDAILGTTGDRDEFVAGLFAEVGDS